MMNYEILVLVKIVNLKRHKLYCRLLPRQKGCPFLMKFSLVVRAKELHSKVTAIEEKIYQCFKLKRVDTPSDIN